MRRIFGLLLICFAVGVVLAVFGTSPRTIFTDTLGAVSSVLGIVLDGAAWAMPYILLGAIVVVPVAVIGWVMRAARRGS